MRIRGKNPALRFIEQDAYGYDDSMSATYAGVATKTGVLLGIIAVIALYSSYTFSFSQSMGMIITGLIVAPIVAIIAVIITHRRPEIAIFTTIIYAIAEGLFLGLISTFFAYQFGGEIVQMALLGTFGVLAGMLFLYSTGIIRVGPFFRRLMFSMLIGLLFSGLILFVLAITGVARESFYDFYVAIVVISVIVSSLFLLIDFDTITNYVDGGAPKELEWALSLGLVVTIVWIYIELLRLFAILANRRR